MSKSADERTNALISVVIPTYNRSKYVERAILSVLNQSYNHFEIIIVDDCSTDNTHEIIQRFIDNDQRITYISHSRNKGAQAARNTGIHAAKGNWIAFLDSDDEWLPNSLTLRMEAAIQQNVQVIHTDCYVVRFPSNEQTVLGVPALSGLVLKELLNNPGPMFQGMLVKKSALEYVGYIDEKILSFQEWDTAIRLSQHFPFGFVEEPTFVYHCHGDDTISKDSLRHALGYEQIMEKHKKIIISFVGRKSLAAHYVRLGLQYKKAGKMRDATKNCIMSVFYDLSARSCLRCLRGIISTL